MINIEPHYKDGQLQWRAIVHLDRVFNTFPMNAVASGGVCGSSTDEGPWIGTTAPTPEQALSDLLRLAGAVYLASLPARKAAEHA